MGLEAAGMTTVFQCEIDKHARSVLDYHWPSVPKWDDVTTLTGKYILEHTDGVDVVAWGSPCQDLSLAGKRAGLSGERSGLFHEGIRIIKELRELSNGKYPTWSIWENVYGALSSNRGADFGQVLYEMDEAGACFSEWAVLDAQYFGVPQRRRRVFVTSCFDPATSSRCPEPLLPVSESLPGDSSKGKQKGKDASSEATSSVRTSGRQHRDPIAYSIREDAKAGNFSATEIETARALQALQPSVQSHHTQTFITQPLLLDGRRVDDVRVYTEPVQTLQERMGTGGNNVPVVAQEPIGFSHTQGLDSQASTVSFPTLRTQGNGMSVAQEPYASSSFAQYNEGFGVLKAAGGDIGGGSETLVIDSKPTLIVRRLTPLECERLMGWPDNHTAEGTTGVISDTNRYKMCGNGVASPVAAWIGKHLLAPMLNG